MRQISMWWKWETALLHYRVLLKNAVWKRDRMDIKIEKHGFQMVAAKD